jgi:hypothetical protein
MKRSVLLASVIALLAASSPLSWAEDAGGSAGSDPDCNRVIKASSESDKKPSPKQLADELNLPLEKVNACLLKVRHSGSGNQPTAPK